MSITESATLHHTCYVVHSAALAESGMGPWSIYPSRVAMNQAKAELIGQGREVVQSAVVGEIGEFCYFHIAEIGSLLELLYLSELPPPEKTIG